MRTTEGGGGGGAHPAGDGLAIRSSADRQLQNPIRAGISTLRLMMARRHVRHQSLEAHLDGRADRKSPPRRTAKEAGQLRVGAQELHCIRRRRRIDLQRLLRDIVDAVAELQHPTQVVRQQVLVGIGTVRWPAGRGLTWW